MLPPHFQSTSGEVFNRKGKTDILIRHEKANVFVAECKFWSGETAFHVQLLQQWQKRPTAPVFYYLFDLLWTDGRDLTGKTVVQRRDRLQQIITPIDGIQVGGYVESRGKDLFQLAKEKGLEGIIAKRKSSIYRPGKRSPDWLKIKSRPQQEFVVCGFTEGKGSRKHFGALLLGAYRNGKLQYFGHSGTGFSEKGLADAIDRLRPFFTDKPPVENPRENPMGSAKAGL